MIWNYLPRSASQKKNLFGAHSFPLTLSHSERPKLYTILAFLSAIGLNCSSKWRRYYFPDLLGQNKFILAINSIFRFPDFSSPLHRPRPIENFLFFFCFFFLMAKIIIF